MKNLADKFRKILRKHVGKSLVLVILVLLGVLLLHFYNKSREIFKVDLHRTTVNDAHLKAPQKENVFRLGMANSYNHDMWVVFSVGSKNTSENPRIFKSLGTGYPFSDISIDCSKSGGKGEICVLYFIGEGHKNSFTAMLLKAGARIECEQYPLVSWGGLDELNIDIVRTLLVDGKTPLEEWLPYDAGNYGDVNLNVDPIDFMSGKSSPEVKWKDGKGISDIKKLNSSNMQFEPVETFVWRSVANTCERR